MAKSDQCRRAVTKRPGDVEVVGPLAQHQQVGPIIARQRI